MAGVEEDVRNDPSDALSDVAAAINGYHAVYEHLLTTRATADATRDAEET